MNKERNGPSSVIIKVSIVQTVNKCLPHAIWAACIYFCVNSTSHAFAGRTTFANVIAAFSIAVDTGCSVWHIALTTVLCVALVIGIFAHRRIVSSLKDKNEKYKKILEDKNITITKI